MDDGARPSRAIASANPGLLRIPTPVTYYFSLRSMCAARRRVSAAFAARASRL
ncbi:hypothetical protein LG3211_1254 [Lysobacter gummosus]|nr:hypothetical protein LG3211_1254 [Lysobacter gummosus]